MLAMYIGCCASARHGVAAVHYCHHAALRSTAAIHCGNVSLLGKTRKDQTRQTGRRDGGDGQHKSATLRKVVGLLNFLASLPPKFPCQKYFHGRSAMSVPDIVYESGFAFPSHL
eukprot:COSAG01_NODE_1966_length_8778_cov_41.983176_14_plen_114_part_00